MAVITPVIPAPFTKFPNPLPYRLPNPYPDNLSPNSQNALSHFSNPARPEGIVLELIYEPSRDYQQPGAEESGKDIRCQRDKSSL